MERQKLTLSLVGVLVLVAGGFVYTSISSERGPDTLPKSTCEEIEMQVNHYQGESQRTRFVYSKDLETNRVAVEWVFSQSNVTKEIELGETEFDSKNYYTVANVEPEGSFEYLRVNPVGCPEKAFRFPPGEEA